MEEIILLDRHEDGSAIAYYANRAWRRTPAEEPDRPGRWTEESSDEDSADDKTKQILEDGYRNPDTPIVTRWSRLEPGWNRGDRVFHEVFGFGRIVTVQDGKFVLKFGKNERVLRPEHFKTRLQAEMDWHFFWRTGKRRRLEEGRRLYVVKRLCRHGQWRAFLTKYHYPRSTADDLIKLYKAEGQTEGPLDLPGNRANGLGNIQEKARAKDRDEVERDQLVNGEREKRRGKQPTQRKTWWAVRIELQPDIAQRCRRKYADEGRRARKFWRRAAYKFVGLEPPTKKEQG